MYTVKTRGFTQELLGGLRPPLVMDPASTNHLYFELTVFTVYNFGNTNLFVE